MMLSKCLPSALVSGGAVKRGAALFAPLRSLHSLNTVANKRGPAIKHASFAQSINNNNNNNGWRHYSTKSNQSSTTARNLGVIGAMGLLFGAGELLIANAADNNNNNNNNNKTGQCENKVDKETGYPIIDHPIIFPPDVPPPIERNHPAVVRATISSVIKTLPITPKYNYQAWTFDGKIPGPFIRARVGDVLELSHRNDDPTGMQHNIDFHAVSGPGGGAPLLNSDEGETRTARFKLLDPGLFVYHCAAGPIPMHIGNGMYGLILVEPEGGMDADHHSSFFKSSPKKKIKEYAVMQGEFYVDASTTKDPEGAQFDYSSALKEQPDAVLFNGKEGSLTHGNVLQATVGEPVRLYFGNGGPNLTSTLHVIGAIFDKVYREGSLVELDRPDRGLQCVQVGPGSAAIVEFTPKVPGNYTIVDHALCRLDKGCVGFISAKGDPKPEIYSATKPSNPCPGCKVHP